MIINNDCNIDIVSQQSDCFINSIIDRWENQEIDETILAIIIKEIANAIDSRNIPATNKLTIARKTLIEVLFSCRKHKFHRSFYSIAEQFTNACTLIFLLKESGIKKLKKSFKEHFDEINISKLNDNILKHSNYLCYKLNSSFYNDNELSEAACLNLILFSISIVKKYTKVTPEMSALFLAQQVISKVIDNCNTAEVNKDLLKNMFIATVVLHHNNHKIQDKS